MEEGKDKINKKSECLFDLIKRERERGWEDRVDVETKTKWDCHVWIRYWVVE